MRIKELLTCLLPRLHLSVLEWGRCWGRFRPFEFTSKGFPSFSFRRPRPLLPQEAVVTLLSAIRYASPPAQYTHWPPRPTTVGTVCAAWLAKLAAQGIDFRARIGYTVGELKKETFQCVTVGQSV
jgi:hypothetical protein